MKQTCGTIDLLCFPWQPQSALWLQGPDIPFTSCVRRKFLWGGFIQWHRVVICIWCALFVMSQFDVAILFPNQRFSEVR